MGLAWLVVCMYPAIAWSSLSQQAKKRLNKLLARAPRFVDLGAGETWGWGKGERGCVERGSAGDGALVMVRW